MLIGLQLEGAGQDGKDAAWATEQLSGEKRQVELVILKNRNGKAGAKIPYDYYSLFNYFCEREEGAANAAIATRRAF